MNTIVLIPSRLGSTRLPNKALAEIGGQPMIVRVVRQALAADIGPVVVATADEAIATAVRPLGVKAILTDPLLPSGSDRVHAALEIIDPEESFDRVVNLQGDLPLFAPNDLQRVVSTLDDTPFDVGTLVAPIENERETVANSIVKVACAFPADIRVARALYFSRAPIPWGAGPLWHHVGVYAWRRAALRRFVALSPSPWSSGSPLNNSECWRRV